MYRCAIISTAGTIKNVKPTQKPYLLREGEGGGEEITFFCFEF